MFYAQCDNIGSMYKLAVKVIDDVKSACAGDHFNPKYSQLQNKNRLHVNANGRLRMHSLRHQLP
jgi:hypothetical protein